MLGRKLQKSDYLCLIIAILAIFTSDLKIFWPKKRNLNSLCFGRFPPRTPVEYCFLRNIQKKGRPKQGNLASAVIENHKIPKCDTKTNLLKGAAGGDLSPEFIPSFLLYSSFYLYLPFLSFLLYLLSFFILH